MPKSTALFYRPRRSSVGDGFFICLSFAGTQISTSESEKLLKKFSISSGKFELLLKISFAGHLPQRTLIARRVIAVTRVQYANAEQTRDI